MGEDEGVISTNADRPALPAAPVAVRARAWVVVLGLLALTAFVASAPAASAHAKLVSISPADGSTVATAPEQVVITFSEELLATSVRIEVHDGEGVPVADGAPVVEGAVATQPLVDGLAAGGYSVSYRVVSKDGHPVSGSTTFTARAGAATDDHSPADGDLAADAIDDRSHHVHDRPDDERDVLRGRGGRGRSQPARPGRGDAPRARRDRGARPPGPAHPRALTPISPFGRGVAKVLPRAPLAQLAEQLTLNQRVRGSSP